MAAGEKSIADIEEVIPEDRHILSERVTHKIPYRNIH
jgi:hypothetical protein